MVITPLVLPSADSMVSNNFSAIDIDDHIIKQAIITPTRQTITTLSFLDYKK
jgi:hypothetical protein